MCIISKRIKYYGNSKYSKPQIQLYLVNWLISCCLSVIKINILQITNTSERSIFLIPEGSLKFSLESQICFPQFFYFTVNLELGGNQTRSTIP